MSTVYRAFTMILAAATLGGWPLVPAHAHGEERHSQGAVESAASLQASVSILSPSDGARVEAGRPLEIRYAVTAPRSAHVHVYVDGRERGVVRRPQGTYTLDGLTPGEHVLGLKVVNRAHVPTGVEASVRVMAQ